MAQWCKFSCVRLLLEPDVVIPESEIRQTWDRSSAARRQPSESAANHRPKYYEIVLVKLLW